MNPSEDLVQHALSNIEETLVDTLLSVWQSFVGHVPFLVAGLAAFLMTWAAATTFQRFSHVVLRRWRARASLKELIVRLLSIGIWSAGIMLTAMIVFPGVTPARALGALGLVSIAVGFAFRDIFENFFAGILILWRFPFETGDFIECDGILGQVEDVTIRMSMIRRPTGELIVVPNSHLFKNPVRILTAQPERRISVIAGIAYDENVADSVDVIREAVESCDTVSRHLRPEVFPCEFGSSSIDIEVAWWAEATPLGERRSRGEVVTAIKTALDRAGIEIPFPYRTLTFKDPLRIGPTTDETA